MKTVLLANVNKFWQNDRGNKRRVTALCKYLTDKGFKVKYFIVSDLDENDVRILRTEYRSDDFYFLPKELKKFNVVKRKTLRRIVKQTLIGILPNKILEIIQTLQKQSVRRPLAKMEPKLDSFYSEEYQRYFQDVCIELNPDVVIIEYIRLAYLINNSDQYLPRESLTMIDTHDVMYQRCKRYHDAGEIHWIDISEEDEKEALNLFDVIIAIQNKDAELFRRMLPHKQVITVGYASEIVFHEPQDSSAINICFIGASGVANRRAITNFIETAWSVLYKKYDNRVNLLIVGKVCNFLDSSEFPDGVVLIGYKDNLNSVYRDADIIINPVYIGGGLKIKNVEALCNGKPLVTTQVGAEGLEHGIDKAFFVCDTPDSTINKLSELIDNPSLRRKMSEQACAFALENFTENKTYHELLSVLLGKPSEQEA